LKATATIVFPEKFFTNSDFSFSKIEAYTGFKSSTEKNYKLEVETKKPNMLFFETTSPLQKYQGLTVYIKWNNNFFSLKDEKSQDKFSKIKKQIMNFYFSNSSASIFLLGSIILFIYYLIAWTFVVKDQKKLKIPPSTNIIENFSPVAIRYLNKMGFDTKCISVSIISLASKGYCTIECTKEKLKLKKTGKEVELSEDEKQIAKLIFSGDSNAFTFDKYSYPLYQIIYQEYKKYLSSKYKNVYFVTNSIFYIIGILISLVTFVLAIFKALNEFEYGFILLWLSFWTVGVVGLLTATIQTWKSRKYSGPGNLIILSIFSSIFILAEVFVFFFFISVMKIYPLLITIIPAIILIILNSIYFKLLKRPTKEGIAIYEEIEALKRFLNQISQDLKNQNHELNLTLELDQLIVYALALDMQQDWFENIFNPSNTSATSYFFHGSTSIPWVVSQEHSSYSNITSLFHYINSSLSSGSSSSSSSGGSSGGGSGGGGGGGW